jgi:hypothetical protein
MFYDNRRNEMTQEREAFEKWYKNFNNCDDKLSAELGYMAGYRQGQIDALREAAGYYAFSIRNNLLEMAEEKLSAYAD